MVENGAQLASVLNIEVLGGLDRETDASFSLWPREQGFDFGPSLSMGSGTGKGHVQAKQEHGVKLCLHFGA